MTDLQWTCTNKHDTVTSYPAVDDSLRCFLRGDGQWACPECGARVLILSFVDETIPETTVDAIMSGSVGMGEPDPPGWVQPGIASDEGICYGCSDLALSAVCDSCPRLPPPPPEDLYNRLMHYIDSEGI